MYGPVRTVVWQGSAGDHRPYADHCLFQTVLLLAFGFQAWANPSEAWECFFAGLGVFARKRMIPESSTGLPQSPTSEFLAKPTKKVHTFGRSLQISRLGWVECVPDLACRREGVKLCSCIFRDSRACCSGRTSEAWFARGER